MSESRRARQDFEDEERYHRRKWVVQRIGWTAMLLLIVVASLGFLGGAGPFTRVEAGNSPNLKISYERFLRYAATSAIDVSVDAAGSRSFTLEINDSYLQHFDLESILPEPRLMDAAQGRLIMTFEATSTPTTITLRMKPEQMGGQSGVFRVSSGDEITIEQFVYP
jgi:hypothetical protein